MLELLLELELLLLLLLDADDLDVDDDVDFEVEVLVDEEDVLLASVELLELLDRDVLVDVLCDVVLLTDERLLRLDCDCDEALV